MQARFVVAVNDVDTYVPAPHTAAVAHTRSVDSVAAVVWYSKAVHTLAVVQLTALLQAWKLVPVHVFQILRA